MAPHTSTLAWKIPWTEEPVRLQSMGSRRVRHDWATSLSHFHQLPRGHTFKPCPFSLGCQELPVLANRWVASPSAFWLLCCSFTGVTMKWSEVKSLSCIQLSASLWTVVCQAPLSMGFSRQEYWCGLLLPSLRKSLPFSFSEWCLSPAWKWMLPPSNCASG